MGGAWGGRRLPIPDVPGLRPSPDRVRETLFNWLQPFIEGADCLDLFAGTGVLGFEALSRGAARASMVEQHADLVRSMREGAEELKADGHTIVQAEALAWLAECDDAFDIVFLDPPFGQGLINRAVDHLVMGKHLKKGALIYVEREPGIDVCSRSVKEIKHSRAGQVQYSLFAFDEGKT